MEQSVSKVEQAIKTAYEIVTRAGIKEPELAKEAFIYALHNVTDSAGPVSSVVDGDATVAVGISEIAYERIARGLDIPLETIELLYDATSDGLTLNLPAKALPDSTSAAMREIAVLLAVGRKHVGIASGAPFELIRLVCQEHGKLDKKNFAAAMSGMKPRLSVVGKGTERELIPKRPADDWARELIHRYAQNLK